MEIFALAVCDSSALSPEGGGFCSDLTFELPIKDPSQEPSGPRLVFKDNLESVNEWPRSEERIGTTAAFGGDCGMEASTFFYIRWMISAVGLRFWDGLDFSTTGLEG
ncbi:hypothetical protein TNCT_580121 [Trichonephila clavata]|uniref:Uncharacterized protein n=1 Tax=Trichonephila clavata TaxID=2740835 RepID=A0A8X6LSG7_TRICU|nr:hypothetical protein TNCT_580121 [Trichonephila clavata]